LACRGFTLRQLLDFYKSVPEKMPHFDPAVHTTTDVVRQVIIPCSADQKCAFVQKMTGGKPIRPKRMVTHNWSNLFRDLVAAIVADALHQSTFSLVAELLDTDVAKLEQMLSPNALAMTYWVCAFSVNQHYSICARNPAQSSDPVTGVTHPVCGCGSANVLNDTPPLRSDGKSIPCQMNKFDDMMAFLSATDPDFAQVVAVDRGFGLFSRAWCVAELAMADTMGMHQLLKLSSHQALDQHRGLLEGLQVEKMNAARPEDVLEILSKIPDVPAFNARLQEMLFGDHGLFSCWASVDFIEQAAEVGRVACLAEIYAQKVLRSQQQDGGVPQEESCEVICV